MDHDYILKKKRIDYVTIGILIWMFEEYLIFLFTISLENIYHSKVVSWIIVPSLMQVK